MIDKVGQKQLSEPDHWIIIKIDSRISHFLAVSWSELDLVGGEVQSHHGGPGDGWERGQDEHDDPPDEHPVSRNTRHDHLLLLLLQQHQPVLQTDKPVQCGDIE